MLITVSIQYLQQLDESPPQGRRTEAHFLDAFRAHAGGGVSLSEWLQQRAWRGSQSPTYTLSAQVYVNEPAGA